MATNDQATAKQDRHEKTIKLDRSGRLINFFVGIVIAIPLFFVAWWLSSFHNFFIDIIYWGFSVWTIYVLINGIIGLISGYSLGSTKLFWIAFLVNIPVQFILGTLK